MILLFKYAHILICMDCDSYVKRPQVRSLDNDGSLDKLRNSTSLHLQGKVICNIKWFDKIFYPGLLVQTVRISYLCISDIICR